MIADSEVQFNMLSTSSHTTPTSLPLSTADGTPTMSNPSASRKRARVSSGTKGAKKYCRASEPLGDMNGRREIIAAIEKIEEKKTQVREVYVAQRSEDSRNMAN